MWKNKKLYSFKLSESTIEQLETIRAALDAKRRKLWPYGAKTTRTRALERAIADYFTAKAKKKGKSAAKPAC